MSLKEEHDDALERFEEAVEISKKKLRVFLLSKSKEERFRLLRETFSLKGIESMCEWALPDEDYEICASVEEVKSNNIEEFKVRFSFQGEDNNKALIVKFIGADNNIYYHADYILDDDDDGSITMLNKNEAGLWISETVSTYDADKVIPIGEAIDAWEAKNKA